MKNFFFVRHGPVSEEYRKVFYGQLDIPLSEEGKLKSLQVVEKLSQYPIRAVFSSPLERALFPAKVLAEKKKIPLEIKEALKEINYGAWTGKPREEIYRETLYWKRLKDDALSPPEGESIKDLRKRARSFWENLSVLEDGLYVIFTHGGFIRALLCEILFLDSRFFLTFEVFHLKGVLITFLNNNEFYIRGINLDPEDIEDLINRSYW
jgi:broad specificity phosphatase PhoE